MSTAVNPRAFNRYGRVGDLNRFEMARALRTVWQSIVTPVITTSLYFVVFGSAIGSRMTAVDGVPYGAFIVPGLIMLSLFTESIFKRLVRHLLPEIHRHDLRAAVGAVSYVETVLAYVGAAATKSIVLGVIILTTAHCSCRSRFSTRSG